jgi:holo-[acyl-carrier protein] synthase
MRFVLFYVGLDIVSISRIKAIIGNIDLLNSETVLKSIFSRREIKYCAALNNSYKHYAVRFAGKEAFLKALGTGLRNDFLFSDIEFLNDSKGRPYINRYGKLKQELLKRKINKVEVSFSHNREQAIAIVILET